MYFALYISNSSQPIIVYTELSRYRRPRFYAVVRLESQDIRLLQYRQIAENPGGYALPRDRAAVAETAISVIAAVLPKFIQAGYEMT